MRESRGRVDFEILVGQVTNKLDRQILPMRFIFLSRIRDAAGISH